MTIIHIKPGPSYTLAVSPDDRQTRWCFGCREHLPHTWALLDDPPERQPSYYEPVPVIRCSRCGRGRTEFPGIYRDGPNYPSEGVWKYLTEMAQAERDSWDWDAIWARDRARTAAAFPRKELD